MGRLSLTMAWWAVCSAMFYIVVGASLPLSYGARNALIGMVLSIISYGLVSSVLSRFAIRSGQAHSRRLSGQKKPTSLKSVSGVHKNLCTVLVH